MADDTVYPYIPNSVPEVKEEMLKTVGISSTEDIYAEIPDHLRFKRKLEHPGPIPSEYALRRHVEELLDKNKDCKQYIGFLGGGVWNHHVPSVVTTIMERDEFLTSYVGEAYADHGKWQAQFEFASCMAELLEMDMVNTPTYDWGMAAATVDPHGLPHHRPRRGPLRRQHRPRAALLHEELRLVGGAHLHRGGHRPRDGADRPGRPEGASSTDKVAVFYFENPAFLGMVETQAAEIVELVHAAGALVAVGVDPISLGVLEAPGVYGADIACGDVQPLGIPMQGGGGQGGFVATQDEPRFTGEFPSLLFGVTPTIVEGEYGFGEVFFERTSYASREKAKDFLGTMAQLHGIGAGVYLSLMGPQGMARDRRGHHAARRLLRRPARRAARRQGARASRRPSSRSSWSTSTAPARPWPRSTRPCSSTRSSAARTSPRCSRAWVRARSTASPRSTPRATSTRSSAR